MARISAFFKRLFALLVAAIAAVLPVKPAPEAFSVTLSVPAVTAQTEIFEVTIHNNTAGKISYGLDSFSIDKKTPLGWKAVPKDGDYAVIMVLLSVMPGGTAQLRVNLPHFYGKTLEAGTYRFNFMYYAGSGEKKTASETFEVAA